jgi:protein-S-isoprenylcysteine O-methyltransferase Ste14
MAKALSVVGYVAMVGGLLGLILLRQFFSPSPFVLAPQVAAVLLMLWARFTFGRRSFHAVANPTEGGLITTGPYRFVRHPIYTAVCLFVLPAVVAHWSVVSVLFGMLVLAGTLLRIFLEEKMLVVRYPEYRVYAASTARMIPLIF